VRSYCKGYSGFVNSDLLTGPKPKKAGFQRLLQAVALAMLELLVLVLGRLWARLPARPGAPLAPPSVQAPDAEADPRDAAPGAAAAALPCVVFSHGLGGTRTAYSGHACAFASSGRVVCALEHGDATACLASIPARPPAAGARPAKGAWLLYGGCGSGAERWAKVARRCSEASLVLDLLQALAEQKPGTPLPHAPRVTWPERLPPPPLNCPMPAHGDASAAFAFLEQFRGRVDTDALVAAGHSFGGATAIALARADARIAACVVNDPWLHACAPSDTAATPWRHPVALLVTLCEDWTVSKLHDEAAMARVRDGVRSGGGVAALVGQRGTTHISFGDVVFFIPHALTRRLRPGFKKDPPPPPGPQAVAAFALMDAFLRRHTGAHRATSDEAHARADRVAAAAMKAAGDGDAAEALAWRDDDGHAQMIAKTLGDDALVLMS
jgi:dienelactone hydrolase